MTDRHELRWGGFAGLGFVILAAVALFLPGRLPALDSGTDEITGFISDNRTMLLVAGLMWAASAALVIWFAAAFAEAIRERAERSDVHLALLAGSVLVGGAIFLNAAVLTGAAYGVDDRSGELTTTMYELSMILTALVGFASALPLTAAGIGVLRTHLMPDWLGYLAMVAAACAVIGAFSVFVTEGAFLPGGVIMGIVPLLVAAAFVLCASIYMVREHLPEVMAPKAMPQT
jgi:hypothetical protein